MNRIDIINHLIKKYKYVSYLEIGVENGVSLNGVECEKKIGVDPASEHATYHVTSDEFFASNQDLFDIIFIDGLHEAEQVKRDIANALVYLKDGGRIVMHDCNPTSEQLQKVPREQLEWTGDVWKAYIAYRKEGNIEMYVVDTDYGVGVLNPSKSGRPLELEINTYQDLDDHRKEALNLISVEEFMKP